MHPAIIYIRKSEGGELVKEIKTQLGFTPELHTTIYSGGVKSTVYHVLIDVDARPYPAIIINSFIK